jgi:sugar lactone lactonase YvrE
VGALDGGEVGDSDAAPATDDGGSGGPGEFSTDASGDASGSTPGEDAGAPRNDAAADSGDEASVSDDAGPTIPAVIHYVTGAVVSTVAGSSVAGTTDGTGAGATFDNPTGMALDGNGNMVVTDYDGGRVRLVTPEGVVTTLAAGAGFALPFDSVVASDGTYYVGTDADPTGTKGTTTGTVWRITPLPDGGVGVPLVVATGFGRARGLAAIAAGNLFVDDRALDVAEELATSTGVLSSIAGTSGVAGYADETGAAARFSSPVGSVALADGSVLVADSQNNRIRRVTSAGVVTTFAGTGVASLVDAPCASAGFNGPGDVAVDEGGNVYVSDIGNHVIRRIDANCQVETVAGTGVAGFNDGAGNIAQFYGLEGIDVAPDGHTIYVTDGNRGDGSAYNRVRSIALP